MQNFLVNPYSQVLAHLIDTQVIAAKDPVRIGFSIGNHTGFLDCRTCPDLFVLSVASALIHEQDIPHTAHPNGEDASPNYILGEGLVNLRAYVEGFALELCDFTAFAADMVASEKRANDAFFCDWIIVKCLPTEEGLVFEDVAVKKIWEVADIDEDGAAALSHGCLLALEDPFGEATFADEQAFLKAAAQSAAEYCRYDAEEWLDIASGFVAPYTDDAE